MASLLRVKNLTYALPYRVILQALSFEVAAGESILVAGASGAGKTLLLRLLNRLTTPSSGNVHLAEREYRSPPVPAQLSLTIPQWRRQVALVSAAPDLLGMTVQDAVLYPLQLQKLSAQQAEQRLVWLLEQWPLPEEWLSLTAAQLSIEQQQLVAVARSLVLQPRVLLLDEPMQYLGQQWLARIREIAQGQGIAIVATGQRIAADRVLYLQAGRLAWDRDAAQAVDWDELQADIDRIEQAEAVDW